MNWRAKVNDLGTENGTDGNGLNGNCFVQASLEQASREAMTGVDHSFLNDPVTLLFADINPLFSSKNLRPARWRSVSPVSARSIRTQKR